MHELRTFHPRANVVVIGSSGGIGAAFVQHLASDPGVATVRAFARDAAGTATDKLRCFPIDLGCGESIARSAALASCDGPLDLVVVATGVLHRGAELQPEKSMRQIEAASMAELFRINTIGPALVARHFLPKMRRGHKTAFAVLSARVGSLGDNRLGGWISYRTSKAALNMVTRTLAIEHARRWPDGIVVSLHPGTVETGLSAPFRERVPKDRLLTPFASAGCLLDVLDRLKASDSGGFFAWDGSPIAY